MTIDFITSNPLPWILTGIEILAATGVWLLGRPFRLTATAPVPDPEAPAVRRPSLTVVVYASTQLERLDAYLQTLMQQDYGEFDVVLVYDSGPSATAAVSEHYAALYDNLYFTFIPPGSHNLSRRKLAITLGLKAARGEVVLLTSACCDIPSVSWLSGMMRPFCNDNTTEVVLGHARYNFDELRGLSKWYRQFDAFCTAVQWTGAALAHRPYRGDGLNLAFMRRLFFEQKGFAKTINLETGDDDLFINDITDRTNTAVVFNPEARLTVSWGDAAQRMWTERKERHAFTAQWLPQGPFLRAGAASTLRWLALGCAAAAVVLSLPHWFTVIMPLVILLGSWALDIVQYRAAAQRLGSIRLCLSVPLFMLWHPLGNTLFRMRHRADRKKNFTWQRRKRHKH